MNTEHLHRLGQTLFLAKLRFVAKRGPVYSRPSVNISVDSLGGKALKYNKVVYPPGETVVITSGPSTLGQRFECQALIHVRTPPTRGLAS